MKHALHTTLSDAAIATVKGHWFIINHDDDDNTDTLTSFFGIWYADLVKLFVEARIFTKRRIKVTNLSAFLNIISPDKKTME
jgi:hypothetical protein